VSNSKSRATFAGTSGGQEPNVISWKYTPFTFCSVRLDKHSILFEANNVTEEDKYHAMKTYGRVEV